MPLPRLPYWLYVGRAATPVSGSVYVVNGSGDVVETPHSAVLTPRMRFFAAQGSVTNLVKRGLVKRLKHPEEKVDKPAPVEVAAPPKKSPEEPEKVAEKQVVQDSGSGSEAEPQDDVIASVAGDSGEAQDSLSVPEEQEPSTRKRRKGRRRD